MAALPTRQPCIPRVYPGASIFLTSSVNDCPSAPSGTARSPITGSSDVGYRIIGFQISSECRKVLQKFSQQLTPETTLLFLTKQQQHTQTSIFKELPIVNFEQVLFLAQILLLQPAPVLATLWGIHHLMFCALYLPFKNCPLDTHHTILSNAL